jgi:hypothetical protein
LASGAVVTFTEDTPPVLSGVVWGNATFFPTSLTIGNGTTADVTITNEYSEPIPAIWSQAYVGGVPNGTVASESTTIVDVVFYENLLAGENYELHGELVYIEGGVIVYTGITGIRSFTPVTTDGSIEVNFTLTDEQLKTLAGRDLFIFQTLFDENDDEVAFDGATLATDPWFSTTDEWFRVAPAVVLAFTGTQPIGPAIVGFGSFVIGTLLVIFASRRRTSRGAAKAA